MTLSVSPKRVTRTDRWKDHDRVRPHAGECFEAREDVLVRLLDPGVYHYGPMSTRVDRAIRRRPSVAWRVNATGGPIPQTGVTHSETVPIVERDLRPQSRTCPTSPCYHLDLVSDPDVDLSVSITTRPLDTIEMQVEPRSDEKA